jgi:vitamin K-dependent gamma-carboxylase
VGWAAGLTPRAGAAVPGWSVAAFRIAFGLLVSYSSVRFLARGWVERLYLAPANHLTYAGFDWVRPLPAPLMYSVVVALAVLGLCIAAGFRTRVAAALFAIGFAYTELIEASLYLNHYWFVTLAALWLVAIPASGCASVDRGPGTVPAWAVWALRGQLAVVYVFAGIAKLNADWLWHATPMRLWLPDRANQIPVAGALLEQASVAFAMSWAGALFDLTIVGWLLWRRSRPYAYAAVVAFHLATLALFQIGVFGWVMIALTPVFFGPSWPARLLGRFSRLAVPAASIRPALRPATAVALAAVAALQITVPLRHLAHPGDVRWTEEGYYLSWRVVLTEKAGWLEFWVTDPATAETWVVQPTLVLEDWQARQAAIRPDLALTAAHLVARHYREVDREVEVRADSWVSFNGRPRQRLLDPAVDLAAQDRGTAPFGFDASSFVLPLDPPVRG